MLKTYFRSIVFLNIRTVVTLDLMQLYYPNVLLFYC